MMYVHIDIIMMIDIVVIIMIPLGWYDLVLERELCSVVLILLSDQHVVVPNSSLSPPIQRGPQSHCFSQPFSTKKSLYSFE